MSGGVVENLGRTLENAFFARQDEEALERLRVADRARSQREALSAASGITDTTVLDHLIDLNIEPRTLAALALVPLVLVAWADGALDAREKTAVLDAAHEAGIDRQAEAATLLTNWLAAPPGRPIAAAWHEYAAALSAAATPPTRAALQRETLGRARRVAEAAGGFLGLGNRVSEAEARVLAELERAFTA